MLEVVISVGVLIIACLVFILVLANRGLKAEKTLSKNLSKRLLDLESNNNSLSIKIASISSELNNSTNRELQLKSELNAISLDKPREIKRERDDAVKKSSEVLRGKIGEEFSAYIPGFSHSPADCKFLGSPIDFICFSGMRSGEIKEIILVEIKTANAVLTQRQKQIRDAVKSGNVRFEEFRIK